MTAASGDDMTAETLSRRNFLLHLQQRPGFEEPVLLKEPAHEQPTAAQIRQLHNEYAISRQLEHLSGIRPVYGVEGTESHPIILLKFIDGQSLTEVIETQQLDLQQKLQLAVEITRILEAVHENGVIHRNISSSNIIISKRSAAEEIGELTLIDLGLATTVRHGNLVQSVTADVDASSLAYISPEQTTRINRTVDHRSDLYSLGVTLYELFTGQLPFQGDDPMEVIHAHIAVHPNPIHQIDAELPEPVSKIILRLIAKNAEDRYQSAGGLSADLERCQDQLQNTGFIEPFTLGQDDFSGRLQIPQRLYGRQAEIQLLLETYEHVAEGNPEIMFITGYSGVGKTVLVQEMRREILLRRGTFIEGKFDQLQLTLPYSAWVEAFTQLANNWLAESETMLAYWRQIILEAVGEQGQILIDIIPTLEQIIGPQPMVPTLGGVENRNRFSYTFNRFIKGLGRPEHPLIVFLDDLQWIDPASLNLIESLLASQTKSSFLIIGAYRDNEVDDNHPLIDSLEKIRDAGKQISNITLADLSSEHTNQLLADTLHLTAANCQNLGQALIEKTAGNPFYLRQLLFALEGDGRLSFNREQQRWVWEENIEDSLEAGGNVIDLMVNKIRSLPNETQQTLGMAACIGSRFKLSNLRTITRRPQKEIMTDLGLAMKDGLVVRSDGHYMFSHDRIQEAGYSLIPKADLAQTHLDIGRLLRANAMDEELDEEIFAIVGQLNAGRALIAAKSEKLDLADLNLKAGQKAKASAAFSNAKEYVEIGLGLLEPGSWQDQYDLTLSLYNENAELAALTGQYDKVSNTAAIVHASAISILDRIRIYMVQIEAEAVRYNFDRALEIGLEALKDLGFEIASNPEAKDYQLLKDKLASLLVMRSEESWSELAEMTDDTALAFSSLLASEMSPSYIGDPPLYPIFTYSGANLTLEYGLDVWSPFFLASVAFLALGSVDHKMPVDVAYDQIKMAKKLQQIAEEMLRNPLTTKGKARTLLMLAHVAAWTEPIDEGVRLAKDTYLSGFQTGDVLYLSNGMINFAKQTFISGMNLAEYQSQMSKNIDSLRRMGQILAPNWIAIHLQTARNLSESKPEPDKLHGSYFDEDDWLPNAIASNDIEGRYVHATCRLLLAYFFDIDERLEGYASDAKGLMGTGKANTTNVLFNLYFPLAKLRSIGGTGTNGDSETMKLINRYLQFMKIWSRSAPSTFQHKYDLIAAEKARVTGNIGDALAYYEKAIRGARASGFMHEEALANELYARFWGEQGNDRFAGPLMREAHTLYQKWGALAKAEHLAKRYPDWLIGRSIGADQLGTKTISAYLTSDLDLLTVLKASQDIAGEIELDGLLAKLMTNVIENSGAQQGYLFLEEDGRWKIGAKAAADETETTVSAARNIVETDAVAQGIVNYVARTQQTVLLDDAAQHGEFIDDPHVVGNQVKSILCTPLVNQGKTSAILYLENNLAPGVFTSDRVELLNMLSAQMAISIDHARTHDQLEKLLDERSQALDSAEAQIRGMFDNSPLGIALSTYEGNLLAVNKSVLAMLRITEEEVMQRSVIDFYRNPSDRDILLNRIQEAGFVQDFGVELVRNDGSSFIANLNTSKVMLRGDEALLAMVEDVTEQVRAETALRESEQRSRALFQSMPLPSYYWQRRGADFILIDCNEAADVFTNGNGRKIVGQTVTETYPDRPDIVEDITRCFTEEITIKREMAYRFRLSEEDTVLSVTYAFAPPDLVIVQTEDISTRKQFEAQLAEAAAREERDRLARELHDAVSQTLFSAGMIADASPTLWQKEPEIGLQNLELLSMMIRGASAEMRSLLLELRPDTLRDQTLGSLLKTLAVAARARSQAVVSSDIEGDCQLADDVTLALHRIAQESLNNVAKHAEAGEIHINLRCSPERVQLCIKDDGRGFDPQVIPAGHLGIGIMYERANKIGAKLQIKSNPGKGTSVVITWPENGMK